MLFILSGTNGGAAPTLRPMFNPVHRSAMQTLIRRDSKPWQLQVWVSFGIALALCAIGLAYLPGQDLDRAFMFMGYLFCLSTAFVLSKFVRDGEAAQQGGSARRVPDTPLFRLVVWPIPDNLNAPKEPINHIFKLGWKP